MEDPSSGYYVCDNGKRRGRYYETRDEAVIARSLDGLEWDEDVTIEYKEG